MIYSREFRIKVATTSLKKNQICKKLDMQLDADCPELSLAMLKSLETAMRNRDSAMAVKKKSYAS